MKSNKLTNSTKTMLLVPILYACVAGIYFWLTWPEDISLNHIAGVAVTGVAFVFWIISRVQLGNAFSLAPKAKFLVTTGIYSKLRHPVYYFSILAAAGITLYSLSSYAAVVLVFLSIVEVLRIQKEEQILRQSFGREYLDYKKSSWF